VASYCIVIAVHNRRSRIANLGSLVICGAWDTWQVAIADHAQVRAGHATRKARQAAKTFFESSLRAPIYGILMHSCRVTELEFCF